MQERDEAIEYLENSIPEKIKKEIREKTGISDFYLDVGSSYKRYADFHGNVKAYIVSCEDDNTIGEIFFNIIQGVFLLSEFESMTDATFESYVNEVQILDYNIWAVKK